MLGAQTQQFFVQPVARHFVQGGKGSSISSSLGLVASARAMETRIFMPPESSRGIGLGHVLQADEFSSSAVVSTARFAGAFQFQAKAHVLRTVRHGSSVAS